MFCHEYLHGAVWGNTRNRNLSASIVHKWQKEGILKSKIEEDVRQYSNKVVTINLLERVISLYKQLLLQKPRQLLPCVERNALEVVAEMKRIGNPVRINQGFRSFSEQNKLYNQGRTTPGLIVTNAKGGESVHQWGVAVDFVFIKEGYNASNKLWNTLAKVGKKHGFEWGGDWKTFIDRPHFQMTKGFTLKQFQEGKVDYSRFK